MKSVKYFLRFNPNKVPILLKQIEIIQEPIKLSMSIAKDPTRSAKHITNAKHLV